MRTSDVLAASGVLAMVAAGIAAIAGYITHIIVAISVLAGSTQSGVSLGYGFLLAVGVIVPPVGMLHGIGVWFGAW